MANSARERSKAALPAEESHPSAPRRRPEEAPAPEAQHSGPAGSLLSLNLPNKLTLSRLVLAPLFALLLLMPSRSAHVAALALYMLLALTDLYDGWLARRTGIVTSFGKFMDPLADKVLVSLALIVFLAKGYPFVPAHLVLLIVGREFLVTGLRSLSGFQGVILVPSLLGKTKTMMQSLFVLATLTVVVLREYRGASPAQGAANPYLLALIWAVTIITLISGLLYFVGTREVVRRVFR